MSEDYSLMIHGGAGALDNVNTDAEAVRYLESIRVILEHGRSILKCGGSAMEAVETCTAFLEDDPLFNAGCGSVLNENGKVEMDAAIMDGETLHAGAVAGVSNIANPITLAKMVIEKSEHVMLIGDGAMHFAEHCGIEWTPDTYFLTKMRQEQFERVHKTGKAVLDHDTVDVDQKFGTVGAVAFDLKRNLAAATSTGGIVNKRWGRVGDSPIVGAGVYADNTTCAVSATGYGEEFMRTVLAKTISDYIEMQGLDARQSADEGIAYLVRKVKGRGGVIVVDHEGNCAGQFTTKKMIHGWIEKGGETVCRF